MYLRIMTQWLSSYGLKQQAYILMIVYYFIYCMQQRENKYSKSLYHWKITNHDNRWANLVCLPNPRKLISTTCAITMSGDWCPMQTPDVMYNERLIYLIRCRNHFLASVDENTILIVTWHWNSPRNIRTGSAPKAHYIVLFMFVAVRIFKGNSKNW